MTIYFSSDYIISLVQNLIVYFFFFLSCIFFTPFNKNLKQQPMKIMGKNIKSYATTQVHFPREGREALRQKVQIFRLKYDTA